MIGHLKHNAHYTAAREIVLALRAAGHQAYFAGGCVRDLLLGIDPQDFDVATSATPDVVLHLFPKTLAVGAHFGVVLVCDEGSVTTEVATFRHDDVYSDGRRPDAVRFSTDPREDVLRRDFTINGMLLDPVAFEETGDAAKATLDYPRTTCAPSAIPRCASPRTSCACCAQYGSPPASTSRSSREPCRPSGTPQLRSIR